MNLTIFDITHQSVINAINEYNLEGKSNLKNKYKYKEARSCYLLYEEKEYDVKIITNIAYRYISNTIEPYNSKVPLKNLINILIKLDFIVEYKKVLFSIIKAFKISNKETSIEEIKLIILKEKLYTFLSSEHYIDNIIKNKIERHTDNEYRLVNHSKTNYFIKMSYDTYILSEFRTNDKDTKPKDLIFENQFDSNIHVIVGKNGSGKSTLLNHLVEDLVDEEENLIVISTSIYDKFNTKKLNKMDNFNFFGGRQGRNMISNIIKFSLIGDLDNDLDDNINKFIDVLNYVGFSNRIGIKINGFKGINKEKILEENSLSNDEKEDIIYLLNKYDDLLRDNKKIISINLTGFKNNRVKSSALGHFLKYEHSMRTLNILNEIEIYLEKNDLDIELKNASSGELMLLSKLLFISNHIKNNSIIIIDEPENSLHPKWQKDYIEKIIYFFNELEPKIIIATHSPLIIPYNIDSSIYSLNNGKFEILDIKTKNNEEKLLRIFDVLTPENRYLSDKLIKLLNKYDDNTITYDALFSQINFYKENSYEKNQINFLDGIIDIAKQMKTQNKHSHDK
ncbi:ATP-binding protein [Aliarcobacter butzleri]|uniref:ATP-binding protein n=1 Tax=Aliarcobacter butzleri TaxID=28197 RepID=UPI0021B1DBD1|nr:ATP-binding protein [Aliarcobacter butzleri]MCT7549080.1 ATP-binding protein [Aliarcobacter butzleri]MCT7558390.1 ATP-binding protein [Aliarcobacter butzleri]